MKLLGWILGVCVLFGVLLAACFAVMNDEDAFAPVVVASHEYGGDYCAADHERGRCGGGYSGGPSGGYYEGGESGDQDYGDGDGDRCRNLCFYGVPMPGEGRR